MIYFSEKNQSFYVTEIHGENIPTGSIEITSDQHIFLLTALNTGCIVFADLTTSPPRPDKFHTWDGSDWVDLRDEDEKERDRLANFKPLTRRQFMRTLVLQGYDLDFIEGEINKIEDKPTRQLALIDWKESTEFQRTDSTLIIMATMLGLSSEQIDAMWQFALTL